jgi:LysR family hydrogen peroxide-inducible transcriptional activator
MSALPSLRQLRYLITLAETLNFTRAAEACFVSQSTLSAGLKELENTLGLQLVERDRQNVALTPSGEAIVMRARSLLAAAEDLTELAKTSATPMQGRIRLGVIPTIAPFVLPSLIPELRSLYPDLQIALREDLTANLLDRLQARKLDMAMIALPYDTQGLITRHLFDDEFWLVGLQGDPAFAQKRTTLPNKVTERLLLLEEGHCLREHSLQACRRTEIASNDGLEATSLLTLIQMVASGLGLALVPEMAIQAGLIRATPELVGRPLESPAPKRQIALVARASTPHLREFDTIAETIVALRRKKTMAITTPTQRRKSLKT